MRTFANELISKWDFFSLPDVMFHFCVDFKIYIITTNTYVTYTARSLGHRVYG